MNAKRDGVTRRCLACFVSVSGALLFVSGPAVAYAPQGAVYGGNATSERGPGRLHPASATVSGDGRKLARLNITSPAPCSPDGVLNGPEFWNDVNVASNGEFSDTAAFTQTTPDGSETVSWESQLQGRLTTRGGSGQTRDVATVRNAAGEVTKTCDTGIVRFKLSRSAGVFGGTVGLREPFAGVRYPVSVVRNRKGTRVTSFHIRYGAKCGTANNHTNSFEHINIPIKRGRFSLSRRFSYGSTTNGNSFVGSFALAGKVGRRGASGTYRAQFRALLASGGEVPCDTGRLRWSAKSG